MFVMPNTLKWRKRFVADLKNKEFMPIKGLFFLIFGANVALIPFLTLQARSLGITEEEVGIIYSFIPIAALIAPPVAGMLADRIGNFRVLLSSLTALAGLSAILFLFVPPGRIIHKLPNTLPLEITCGSPSFSHLGVASPYECVPTEKFLQFAMNINNCSVVCSDHGDVNDTLRMAAESNLHCANSRSCLKSSTHEYGFSRDWSTNTSIEEELTFTTMEPDIDFTNISQSLIIRSSKGNSTHKRAYHSSEFICPLTTWNPDVNETCRTVCQGEATREHVCSNDRSREDINPSLTFYSHLVIRLFKEFTIATSMPLLEGAAVTILKEHNGDFGFQRLYCNLGMMLMTPVSGTLIDYYSRVNGFEDFRPAMYIYCGLKLVAAFVILFLNMEFKQASTKVVANFSYLLLNPEIMCFLLATFLAGTCYGYIETFLFWLLEDLGADKQLMGLTLTVGSVFGVPLLMISTAIIKKIGHVNTIVLGFAVYIVRLFGYTIIESPWWAMPFEALECFTVSLMVVSFVSYASILATPSTIVTLQGLYGGLYNGVGRGAGSLIGGFLIENIGIFNAFRTLAAVGGCSGVFYWTINFCLFRNKRRTGTTDGDEEATSKTNENKEEKSKNYKECAKESENSKVKVETITESSNTNGRVNKAFEDDHSQCS